MYQKPAILITATECLLSSLFQGILLKHNYLVAISPAFGQFRNEANITSMTVLLNHDIELSFILF